MAQQLKRWESPRRNGRNQKGRGGSARHRQVVKQQKLWQQRLKSKPSDSPLDHPSNTQAGEAHPPLLFF